VIALLALALGLASQNSDDTLVQTGSMTLKSDDPVYELLLPPGYEPTIPVEKPPRFIRSTGPERWAKISTQVAAMSQTLPQNPSGITAEQILPLMSLPPEATWTFSRTRWKDLDIGVIEYRAVVADLPVIGLSAVLPLAKKGLRITVHGADPLDKEIRSEFEQVLSRVRKAETDWFTDEVLVKIALMQKVTIGGAVLAAFYAIAWVIFFRGNPHGAHWARTIWLFGIALLLFIPVTSPGPTTFWSNLLVNALLPLFFLVMTVRRLKMGIDAD
jgi:hypothetical protein